MPTKSKNEVTLEAVKMLEKDGRKVYKIIYDGKRTEFVLSDQPEADPTLSDIRWR